MTNMQLIPLQPLKTAVLFLVFNRLDTTKQVFEEIKKAKPPRLYIASDGARAAKEGELSRVKAVREYITNNINWKCEVKTLFREQNLGCKYAVSSAITWFFENEEQGIILEDDCLPSQSFFRFCEELLNRYKNDMRVWQISGDNFQNGIIRGDGSYYFSKYNHIWGWATWTNRWKKYDVEMNHIANDSFIRNIFSEKEAIECWGNIFRKMKNKEIDTWDYQWTFTTWINNGLTVLPQKNMISNIGFGADATHTVLHDSKLSNMLNHEVEQIQHPSFILPNREADNYTFDHLFSAPSLLKRIQNKLSVILHK